ncbi:hypothetical protein RND71_003457 [Anisodus tanguticus]|uniref:Uncharacterized protein n=1 Tax=Anisodus tanguticus TaxID=243964 RepID=A0AAE1SWP5_9SOLA|nr:hypothetical protein RND71_003457 [Anisodus tanguticus]
MPSSPTAEEIMKIVEDAKTPAPASRSVGGVGWVGEEVDGENEEVEEEEEDEEDEYEKQVKQDNHYIPLSPGQQYLTNLRTLYERLSIQHRWFESRFE